MWLCIESEKCTLEHTQEYISFLQYVKMLKILSIDKSHI